MPNRKLVQDSINLQKMTAARIGREFHLGVHRVRIR